MTKERLLTQESFDYLLHWLDPDRERAGKKYETIRYRLIKVFTCRGCFEAEDLADETINRVTEKVLQIGENYSGDPALYFYGVARKVHLEYLRRRRPPETQLILTNSEEIELNYACLERCLEKLPEEQRYLVLEYYRDQGRSKIDRRKILADQLGIAVNALRIRAHRIRLLLHECVKGCIAQEILM